ncbi:MAG: multidrug efflux transporter / Acriflavin resistance protein [Evtepia sp.]|jgi:HAE1 family hydrophobic/amphiphilic exporter-1|nr:multidrug efflux transporter / Acriflavin resistance protein [Evtepia sp.]
MNIAAFCIKHKVTTILAFIIISIFGFVVFSDLKLTLIPEIRYPGAYITCYYSGAGPEEVEELVTRPVESMVATIPGVKSIDSTSSENMCTVMVNYTDDTDMDSAAIKLREKFDQLTLPEGCEDPVIYNLNINDLMPILSIAMTGEDFASIQKLAEKEISPALERIDGVAAVNIYGGLKSQITVATDANRLAGYNMSISYLSQYLAGANVLYPGGDVKNGVQALTVTTDGKFKSVSDVANTLIPIPSGGSVRLSDIAKVYLEGKKQSDIAKTDGEDCVVLTISRQSDANEVEAATAVKKVLEELKTENESFNYIIAYDSSEYIQSTAKNAVSNIIMGVVLAAAVVFLFLRRPGATMTIAVSMPFCILSVFVAMKFFNVTLNMISLGGIAMGVGMIVDNSIIVLENIYRYTADGYSRYDACVKGTQEVALPASASTLTTIAVFLPIGLSSGLPGMLFRDFSLTVTFLLLGSLVIALTLVPLLCYYLLDEEKVRRRRLKHDEKAPPLANLIAKTRDRYLIILRFFIRKRFVAMLVSLGLIVLFVVSLINTKTVLLPDVDQGQMTFSVSMPVGTELEQTVQMADKVVSRIQKNCPELESLYYSAESKSASIVVNLVDLGQRSRSSKEVSESLRTNMQDIAGCEISVKTEGMAMMASNESDISVKVTGEDYQVLSQISNDLKQKIVSVDGAVNIKSAIDKSTPAVKVKIKQESAAVYGLTAGTIGSAVRAELTGVTATNMTMDGDDIEVVIKGNETASSNLDALRSMPIAAQTGGYIPLSSVADVTVQLAPQTINRSDQTRQVNITGDIEGTDVTTMTKQIQAVIDAYDMPEGYSAEAGGTVEDMNKSFHDLALALLVALGLIYFVLASQFESFVMPIIVMMILPVALTGALFGLPLTGSDLSIIAVIGLIMLAGVVVNASIILVDYIKVRRMLGASKEEAILAACPLRIRPIMMTTLTTILAMVPMALGIGDGAELMQPMSIVMISGMVISTIITLFFTPVYYSLLDSLTERVKSRFRRKKTPALDEVTPVT